MQSRPAEEFSTNDAAAIASRKLNKSVFALAIEPLTMALSLTGRKAYDVMLWLAHHATPSADGGYSSPVSAIVRGYGSTTKTSERVQRYIEQMVQTTVVWRPLATSEQGALAFEDGQDAPSSPQPTAAGRREITDEARTFPLLAEARLYVKRGEAWVTWYYPPSIREQLISPERWAQLELNSIARLSTYTAVALYEICARYKDSPGGRTSRHEPDFWTRVLREGGGVKPREFRKFKNELLVPAIAEINDLTEIQVELIEHREQNLLRAVQFKVARRARESSRKLPDPVDLSLVMRAAKLGLRESDIDPLLKKYGAERLFEGMAAMETYIDDPAAERILNRVAYLRAVLANRFPDEDGERRGSAAVPVGPNPPSVPSDASALPATEAVDLDALVDAWRVRRLKQLRTEFASLIPADQLKWIEHARAQRSSAVMTPAMRRRFDAAEWESPLILHWVLEAYGASTYGPSWRTPNEVDLMMFSAAEHRD